MVVLAYGLGRTKLQCGLPARLAGGYAGAQVFLRLQRQPFDDLFLQALTAPLAVEKFDRRMKKRRRIFMAVPLL